MPIERARRAVTGRISGGVRHRPGRVVKGEGRTRSLLLKTGSRSRPRLRARAQEVSAPRPDEGGERWVVVNSLKRLAAHVVARRPEHVPTPALKHSVDSYAGKRLGMFGPHDRRRISESECLSSLSIYLSTCCRKAQTKPQRLVSLRRTLENCVSLVADTSASQQDHH